MKFIEFTLFKGFSCLHILSQTPYIVSSLHGIWFWRNSSDCLVVWIFFRIFALLKTNVDKMKKFLFMASLLLASVSGFAQLEKGAWYLTPKAGINIANMTNSDDSEFRVGLAVGADVEHALTSNASVAFGAHYSQQGVAAGESGVDVVFKMDYINFPITLNHYFSPKVAIFAGLQPGFLVNDAVKVSYGGQSVTVSGIKKYLKDEGVDMSSFALSVPVGMSFTFGQVKFDVRYAYELTNTLSSDDENSRHSYFQLTLGYKFDL